MSPILPISGPGALVRACGVLAAGGLVVMPTDTVYGIAARVDRPAALEALFAAKARPPALALPVLCSDLHQARGIAQFSAVATALAGRFWPGALTMVLPRLPGGNGPVAGGPLAGADLGGDPASIGVRVPALAGIRSLLARSGPLATSSANRSGEATPGTIEDIAAVFGDAVALYLDGGPAIGVGASTVVSLLGEPVRVLRAGAIAESSILRFAEAALPVRGAAGPACEG